ncbi:MAG: hypothetical protein ABSH38_02420 [Verrucomicrobiota bacterium]|jgi:hypothetical protein
MNKLIRIKTAMVVFGLASATVAVQAAVSNTGNEAAFDASTTIAYDSFFDDFGTGFGWPGNPFTRGDVTYNSEQNLTWGDETPYTTTEPLIGDNYWTPIVGSIATGPQYSAFGFLIGNSSFWGSSTITIDITTDLGTYVYPSLTIADSGKGQLQFEGYTASPGEYFTGFEIIVDNGRGGALPGITDVTLGSAGSAPDASSTCWLIGMASLGLGFLRRKLV